MRILHIIGTLSPESGGPAVSVLMLNRFRAQGSVHEVVSLDDPGASFLRDLDLQITALGPTWNRYGFNLRLQPWLEDNRDRFDGVVVHGLWQYCGYTVWQVFAGRKPYVVFPHGMLDPYFKRAFPFKHLKKWLYWLLVECWVLRGAFRVLFTCHEEERLARQNFGLHLWNGHIFALGASIPEGDDSDGSLAFIRRFPQLASRRYLLYLGRIDRKKGCDLLIHAFIRAAMLDPELDLMMAGPDEKNWRNELEASVSKAGLATRVLWTGMLTGDEKWGAFRNSEAFILPSHQENFGIAVTEAMGCSKAVLLSDKINIASEIATAGAGLVDADTEEGTLRLISGWIAMSTDERHAMATKARLLFESSYDMQARAPDIGALLRGAKESNLTALVTPASAIK